MVKIDVNKLPRHIAIIMDGNGRWAARHAMGRIRGHRKGAEAVRTTVRTCREIGVKCLTLFAFSIENWERPDKEVKALMYLLEEYLNAELDELQKQEIRLTTIGETDRLNETVRKKLIETIERTAQNDKMILNLALSYGSKDEILSAVKTVVWDAQTGRLDIDRLDKETFSRYLYTAQMPDPDLLIRTSGEYRISNFLLWQMAYTELYFTNVLWPDFTREDLLKAIASYQKRERRFGLTSEQLQE